MAWYARTPARLSRQVAADAFVAVWAVGWWLAGRGADAVIRAIATPAREAAGLGADVRGRLDETARQAGSIPLVGDGLRVPLEDVAGSVATMTDYAYQQVAAIETAATLAGWLVFAIPVLLLVAVWWPARWRFVRHSREVANLASSADGQALLALRALVHQPTARLRRVSPDVLAAWRAGDPSVIAHLAALETERAGVTSHARMAPRPPRVP